MRVAAVQMSSQDDVSENLAEASNRVREARSLGAELVVLPENFAYFGPEEGRRRVAEDVASGSGPIVGALAAVARETGATVVGGGMPEASGDSARPYNTCVVVSPSGDVAARYRKIHLFDVNLADGTSLKESASTSAGTEPVVADVLGRKVGLSVCYDVRFPELYRALVTNGASILVVPAAFTVHTGKDHWHVLLRARAIESQAWVIAAAQWGKHPKGRTTYGHSLIVDPWGTVIAEASDRVSVIVADVDAEHQARVKASLPSLAHRRL